MTINVKQMTPRVLAALISGALASIQPTMIRAEDGTSWVPEGKCGVGVSIVFVCDDALALYREFTARGIDSLKELSLDQKR